MHQRIGSYLDKRMQFVGYDRVTVKSSLQTSVCGVPQWSGLGPTYS